MFDVATSNTDLPPVRIDIYATAILVTVASKLQAGLLKGVVQVYHRVKEEVKPVLFHVSE